MATEQITTDNRDKWLTIYAELRNSDVPEEREVVKFTTSDRGYTLYHLAYPAKKDDFPTPRKARKIKQWEREHGNQNIEGA